jgi:hypothetical protein
MAGMAPEGPGEAPPSAPPGAPEHQRQARYHFLLGRLRSRQITMEEATELFALMEAMLRVSEIARRAAMAPPPRMGGPPALPRSAPSAAAPSSAPDDMFLVGLLAMGAGAGLLAAMSRRLVDAAPPRGEPDKDADARRSS